MNNPIVIIAGGPSLTHEDVALVEITDADIMGVNDAYRICNRLTYLYACDRRWWNWHWARVNEISCRKFALEDLNRHGVEQLIDDGVEGISFEWPKVRTGRNSGYQAINLSILLGYEQIILLGYDLQYTNGKAHWFGDHPKPLNNAPLARINEWIRYFNQMAKELPNSIQILNATRETALSCFPKVALEDAL